MDLSSIKSVITQQDLFKKIMAFIFDYSGYCSLLC